MSFVFSFFLALSACWLILPLLIRYSENLGLLDIPTEERKLHSTPISRAGGIAIVFGTAVAISVSIFELASIPAIFYGSIVIIVFGIWDDTRDIHFIWKFVGQMIAAAIAVHYGIQIETLPLLGSDESNDWMYKCLTFLFIVGVTNAINLSDGLDGLAGGSSLLSLGLISTLAYTIEAYTVAIFAVSIMGGIAGFLHYNTNPARVFMGDTGSQFIGFCTACLAIVTVQESNLKFASALPLLMVGLPIVDTMYVILVRLINKRSPFSADRSHIHHRLARLNFSHREVVALTYLTQSTLLVVAYLLRDQAELVVISTFAFLAISILVVIVIPKRLGWQRYTKQQWAEMNPELDNRNSFFRVFGGVFSSLTHSLSYLLLGALVLALVIILIGESPSGTNTLALVTAAGICLLSLFLRNNKSVLQRFATASTAAIMFFAATHSTEIQNMRYVLDAYLMFALLILSICVRITRNYRDLLNTQDVLVFCLIAVLAIIPFERESLYLFIRIAVCIYISEYLIGIDRAQPVLVSTACCLILCVTAAFA